MKKHLKANHSKEWIDSKVDIDIIELNVKSLSGENAYEYLLYSLERKDRTNTGRLNTTWLNRYKHIESGGWWCNGVDLLSGYSDSKWGCFKPDRPRHDPVKKNKLTKYEHPPQASSEIFALQVSPKIWEQIALKQGQEVNGSCFWQWVVNNPKIPLVITEGAKKAGCLLTGGYAAIALSGVFNGAKNKLDAEGNVLENGKGEAIKALIPQLEVFTNSVNKREIILAVDQDSKRQTSLDVTKALMTLGTLLEANKASVSVLQWDYKLGKGVDDLISGKGVEVFDHIFEARIPLREFRSIKKENSRKINEFEADDFIHDQFLVTERISLNEMSSKIYLDGQEWELEEQLNLYFYSEYKRKASLESWRDALIFNARKRKFHPIKQYFDTINKEASRISIDDLATRYFDNKDPLVNLMVKKTLISAVARIFDPGCKVDTVLTLLGPQGSGKSTWFSTLASSEFFLDDLEEIKGDEVKRKINKAWIHELQEIEHITSKKEAGQIKAFISRTNDNYRELYEKNPIDHLRHCIFVGTVNEAEFLRDTTGNRRFWVVEVLCEKIDIELLKTERDGIWASAVDAYLSGEKHYLSREEEKELFKQNQKYELTDALLEKIDNYVGIRPEISAIEIMERLLEIGVDEYSKHQTKVGICLRKLGFEKQKPVRTTEGMRTFWRRAIDEDLLKEELVNESTSFEEKSETINTTINKLYTGTICSPESLQDKDSNKQHIVDIVKTPIQQPLSFSLSKDWKNYTNQILPEGTVIEFVCQKTKVTFIGKVLQFDYKKRKAKALVAGEELDISQKEIKAYIG